MSHLDMQVSLGRSTLERRAQDVLRIFSSTGIPLAISFQRTV